MGNKPSDNSSKPPLEDPNEQRKSYTLSAPPALTRDISASTLSSLSPANSSRLLLHAASSAPLQNEHLSPEFTPSPRARKSTVGHHRRRSSLLVVHNGVTGNLISPRIAKIGAKFWHKHIDTLSDEQQLEIGCSIFFTMLSANDDMKKIMKSNFNNNLKKIEATSSKFLNMTGWLVRYLITDNIDLLALLQKLGVMHRAAGIKIEHFNPMLQAMHETFSYYFGSEYTIEIKYAFDEIFALAAQLMMNEPLHQSSHLLALNEQFQADNIPFLKSLDVCLHSKIGQEYLYRYLRQTWCDELVIFLQTLSRFKSMASDKGRFMVAREINKTCIEPSAAFAVNVSYECRANVCPNVHPFLYAVRKTNKTQQTSIYGQALRAMKLLEEKFTAKESLVIPISMFDQVESEVTRLISDNHWNSFVDSIQTLQSKSFCIE